MGRRRRAMGLRHRAAMLRQLTLSACVIAGCSTREPTTHRANADTCAPDRPPILPFPSDAMASSQCASDNDCYPNAGLQGRCTPVADASCDGTRPCGFCTQDQCYDDGHCANVCDCRGSPIHSSPSAPNTCLPTGNCLLDIDCSDAGVAYCSPSLTYGCSSRGWVGYFCHTSQDECTNDSDCATGNHCSYEWSVLHWTCSTDVCP